MTARTVGLDVLDRIVSRQALVDHDGRSGATLERVVLDDGRRLVVKSVDPRTDLVMRMTGDTIGRELDLNAQGAFDRLPDGVSSPVLAGGRRGEALITVMEDLGDEVCGWDRILARSEARRIFAAAGAVHEAFADSIPAGLCDLETRLAMFAPDKMRAFVREPNPLPGLVCRGWEIFTELVPGEVSEAVFGHFERPDRLASALSRGSATLLHGDLWLVNVALNASQVTLLDWGVATAGPPVVDFVTFLTGCASHVEASRDQLLEEIRRACGDTHDEEMLKLALFWGLTELGWNKALDAADHPDAAKRARETEELRWWVDRARRAMDEGLLP